jgi:hypothetical protein
MKPGKYFFSTVLIRRGGAPSGAAAYIVIGGMGVSTPINNSGRPILWEISWYHGRRSRWDTGMTYLDNFEGGWRRAVNGGRFGFRLPVFGDRLTLFHEKMTLLFEETPDFGSNW